MNIRIKSLNKYKINHILQSISSNIDLYALLSITYLSQSPIGPYGLNHGKNWHNILYKKFTIDIIKHLKNNYLLHLKQ